MVGLLAPLYSTTHQQHLLVPDIDLSFVPLLKQQSVSIHTIISHITVKICRRFYHIRK